MRRRRRRRRWKRCETPWAGDGMAGTATLRSRKKSAGRSASIAMVEQRCICGVDT